MAATTKAQRMKAIKDNAEKERAKAAAETLAFEKRTAEINKQIAKKNRERRLRANANVTAVPAFEPTSVNLTEVPPLTSSVTPMSAAEEAVIDNDIELARIQQATNGIDINPDFVQRAMRGANANGDNRVTPQTLAGTPSIIDRMSQWDDSVWDSFFDDDIGEAAVAQAKVDMTPTITPEPINTAPNVTPKAVNTVPTMEYTAPINADQRVIENLAELNGGPTPAIDPTVRVPDQVVNGLPPRAIVKAPIDYPMGPTIDITYKPDSVVPAITRAPDHHPDQFSVQPPINMPQNGGPDKGGYPNKTRLPNNPAAVPQRPGYNVVRSGDGSPVKSGNGYAWSKDYQHSIWGDK